MRQNDFSEMLSECCRIGFASIEDYDESERMKIQEFLPEARTVIVVAHHIRHSLEWVWFRFLADGSDETCPADLHTKLILEKVSNKLVQNGFNSIILPYPGQCGVMFKTLAIKTGLGQLGDSFLFMNADWGPWVHLRAILTDAQIEFEKPATQDVCTHCRKCIGACLSGAIMENDFDGIKCRDNMRQIRSSLGDTPYTFECEVCLRACPVGEKPRELNISYGGK